MVATVSTFYLEGQDHAKIALSREGLSALFGQVEADLQRSDPYQEILDRLCQDAEDAVSQTYQTMIRSVGREAIRLAFRRLVRQYRTVPPALPLEHTLVAESEAAQVIAPVIPDRPITADGAESAAAIAPTPTQLHPPQQVGKLPQASVLNKTTPPISRPLTKPKSAEAEKRESALVHIGQILQQARQSQGISLEQLHFKTWVPIYQLRALELGQVERLPEDIYIQGFLRRIAPLLNLDSVELQAPLKVLQPPKPTAVASWQRSPSSSSSNPSPQAFQDPLQPVHLYVGYAALMAGAAGGLVWMAQQPQAERWLPALPELQPQAQSASEADSLVTPSSMMGESGAIASPETLPPQGLVR